MASTELALAKGLLDTARQRGFIFERIAPGEDAPLLGVRQTPEYHDEIFISGCSAPDSCRAVRRRRSMLIVVGEAPASEEIRGNAVEVLYAVLCDWST